MRILIFLSLSLLSAGLVAEEIGSVNTKFKWLGPNDKVVVEVFDDPGIRGVACYLSRAQTGGITGAMGVAEDTSDATISCRQVGPVSLPPAVRKAENTGTGEEVFKHRTSLIFKTLQVVRFYDPARHVLVYLSYSDRVIEGSPKNSLSVVPIRPWNGPADGERNPEGE